MKGGITKRVEDTVKALGDGQLKRALVLTDRAGLERHRQIVEKAARTCLEHKGDKEACTMAIEEAKEQVKDTITLPLDDTSLEGVEDFLTPGPQANEPKEAQPSSERTDEELYEECEECHVATAAARFAEVCAERPGEAGNACQVISAKLEDENTEPADWIKAMVQTAEQAQGQAKEEMVAVVTELTDYLEQRDSPLLKELDKEDKADA